MIAIFIVLIFVGQIALQYKLSDHSAFAMIVIGILGFLVCSKKKVIQNINLSVLLSKRIDRIIFWIVIIAGIFFRFYRLDEVPFGMNHDSAMHAEYALNFLYNNFRITPYYCPNDHCPIGYETMWPIFMIPFILIFGVKPYAIQFASATLSTLTLLIVYRSLLLISGNAIALLVLTSLSLSEVHIIMTRGGWHCQFLPGVESATLALAYIALVSGRTRYFFYCALLTALNLYTYSASRIIPIKILCILLILLFLKKIVWTNFKKNTLIYITVSFILSLPALLYSVQYPEIFWGRAQSVSVIYKSYSEFFYSLLLNIKDTILQFNYRANGDDFVIDNPFLDYPTSAFFIIGILTILSSYSRIFDRTLVLFAVVWFLSSIFGGIISKPNPNHNFGVFIPALTIAGIGFISTMTIIKSYYCDQAKMLSSYAFYFCCASLLGALSFFRLFYDTTRLDYWGFYPETRIVGAYMKDIIDRYDVYVGNNFPIDSLKFMTHKRGSMEARFTHVWENVEKFLQIDQSLDPLKGLAFIAKNNSKNIKIFESLKERFSHSKLLELKQRVYPSRLDEIHALVLLVPAQLQSPTSSKSTQSYIKPITKINNAKNLFDEMQGSGEGYFKDLMGLAVASDGSIFTSDIVNNRIQKFTSTGEFLWMIGSKGSLPAQFNEPRAIILDKDNNLYVSDTWNNRIQKFDQNGNFIKKWGEDLGLYGPRGIAHSNDKIYLLDTGKSRILTFDLEGNILNTFGMRGAEPGELFEAVSICVDKSNNSYVLNSGNNNITIFDSAGKYQSSITISGWTGDGMKEGAIYCSNDKIFVTDPINNSLIIFNNNTIDKIITLNSPQKISGLTKSKDEFLIAQRSGAILKINNQELKK
jgi:hypothetical protein